MMKPKPVYKRGDVILAFFPHSNMRTAGLRPVLVVQANNLQTGLPQVIVAMITSNMKRGGHSSRGIVLQTSPEGQQSGLLVDSVVMTDNLATILETEIDHRIGMLPMTQIDAALRHTLSL